MHRRCPKCAAEVAISPPERWAACPRCAAPVELLVLAAANPDLPRRERFDDAQVLYPMALAVVGVTVLAIAAAVVLIFVNRALSSREAQRWKARETHVAEVVPLPQLPTRTRVWLELQPPAPAKVAGSEGFAGLVIHEEGRNGSLYLSGYDAELHERWTDGPLGLTREGAAAFQVASDGEHVLVTDARPTVRLYAARDGAHLVALPLPARARSVCVTGDGRFDIDTERGHQLLDAKSLRMVASPQASCGPPPSSEPACRALAQRVELRARCTPPVPLAGLDGQWRLVAPDGLAVVVGRDRQAGRLAIHGGAGPKGWLAPLPFPLEETGAHFPPLTDLANGTVYVKAQLKRPPFHPHLLAFDGKSGALLWDRELPREEHVPTRAMAITPTRLYVPTDGQLEIVDAHSGALLGAIGD